MSDSNDLEKATDYLSKHNFKVLVEWFTAEVILNRPKDPLVYIQQCIAEKLETRGDRDYDPKDNLDYMKSCYDEASKNADESGRIQPRKTPRRSSVTGDLAAMTSRLDLLEELIAAQRRISVELDPMKATETIIHEACKLLDCERATLFTLDSDRNELELMVAEGAKSIRLPVGQGVAGTVAGTGKLENIKDAYADPRFDSTHDANTGFKTDTILACPVRDGKDKIVGVVQAINAGVKARENGKSGPAHFNTVNEEVVNLLAAQAGIALNNAHLYQALHRSQDKIRSLLDIIAAMHNNLGINSLMFTITQRAHTLVQADRCTMFLVDEASQELWSLQGEVNLRIPWDKGIAGECRTEGKIINIPDAYADPRFNQAVDKKSGYHTKSILCMPCSDKGKVVGVIQLINKSGGPFDDDDIEIMNSFLIIAGPVLAQSQLFHSREKDDDQSTEFSGKLPTKSHAAHTPAMGGALIEEGEEEGEEEEA